MKGSLWMMPLSQEIRGSLGDACDMKVTFITVNIESPPDHPLMQSTRIGHIFIRFYSQLPKVFIDTGIPLNFSTTGNGRFAKLLPSTRGRNPLKLPQSFHRPTVAEPFPT